MSIVSLISAHNLVFATVDPWILGFSLLTVAVTIVMGFWSARRSRTAHDFFVAGRSVSVGWNASAISGEYLSAASFMGVAGMVMKNGYDALWYPICYACGYLLLLLFIAGPLRRFGAYTIPDFAEGRYDSPLFRKIAVVFVLFIGFFYTMPQMKGAGTTLAYVFPGLHYSAGVVVVGAVITFNVALGGMKGITLVQAFQYWAKMFAISVPIFVLMSVYGHYGKQLGSIGAGPEPGLIERKPLPRQAAPDADWLAPFGPLTTKAAKAAPPRVEFSGQLRERVIDLPAPPAVPIIQELHDQGVPRPIDIPAATYPATNLLDRYLNIQIGSEKPHVGSVQARVQWSPDLETQPLNVPRISAPSESGAAQQLLQVFATNGITVLRSSGNVFQAFPTAKAVITPVNVRSYALLYTYSLIIALVCGTAGLPHILVRFYTNPDGVAAKRTTMWVLILIGVFYLFPPVFGVIGRNILPSLYEAVGAKGTDKVVLELPAMLNARYPVWGSVLSGITCAGAFAAFMSTFSGLLVSMTGALAHDVYGRILRPSSTAQQRLVAFKVSAVVVGAVAILLGTQVEKLDINFMVGQAFAIAAASYFPLLFLSAWWRGMTMRGAAWGMLGGGVPALLGISLTSFTDLGWLKWTGFWATHPLLRILCEQPAIWAMPLAILLMIVVSRLTRKEIPADIRMKMLVLHAPEKLGIKQEYIRDHQQEH